MTAFDTCRAPPPLLATDLSLSRCRIPLLLRWRKVKTKDLPKEFWEERRKQRNKHKSSLYKKSLRARNSERVAREEEELSVLPPEERRAREEAAFQERIRVKKERQKRLEDAFEHGIRVFVDCAYASQMNEREVRSLAKQLELCSAINKRAQVPVRLEFCGFTGHLK
eukprot:scaffold990_cov393-Prasinococcus_capsulatus_cf.AAC.35